MPKMKTKLGSEEEIQGDGNGEVDAPESGAEPPVGTEVAEDEAGVQQGTAGRA